MKVSELAEKSAKAILDKQRAAESRLINCFRENESRIYNSISVGIHAAAEKGSRSYTHSFEGSVVPNDLVIKFMDMIIQKYFKKEDGWIDGKNISYSFITKSMSGVCFGPAEQHYYSYTFSW